MNESESFLNNTLSQPFENNPHVLQNVDWFFVISLIFLVFLAFIKLNYYKPFIASYRDLLKSGRNQRTYNNQQQTHFPFFPFIMSTCIVFSLICYVSSYQLFKQGDTMIFLWSFAIIIVLFLGRYILLRLVSLLFNKKNIVSESENLTATLDFISAILCFPFIFIAYYYSSSILLILTLSILTLAFFIKSVRRWTIFKKEIRIYEYFLYLCSVEILPLIILLKFVTNRLLLF